MKKKMGTSIQIPSAKNEDQPASRRMLSLVRDELKSDIRALSQKMDSRFLEQDAKFKNIDARFNEIKADFFRTQALLEEQHSNNRIVLEGLQALWQRQDRIEQGLNSR